MDEQVVQDLVSFALAEAARQDHAVSLGPIHLMKLLYLADWAYAKAHGGTLLTGISWKFHHFGPYANAVEVNIERAANRTTSGHRTFYGNKSGREVKRWEMEQEDSTESLYLQLEERLPFEGVTAIKRAIREFGSATYPLLHHVYATPPMRRAAPGEILDFAAAVEDLHTSTEGSEDPDPVTIAHAPADLSKTQRKKREKAIETLKARMEAARIRSVQSQALISVEPVVDAVYEEGVSWLDNLQGQAAPFTGTLDIDPSIWRSAMRRSVQ